MTELTPEKCLELEKTVVAKLCPPNTDKDNSFSRMREAMCIIAARTTIVTIQEYEKMKRNEEDSQ